MGTPTEELVKEYKEIISKLEAENKRLENIAQTKIGEHMVLTAERDKMLEFISANYRKWEDISKDKDVIGVQGPTKDMAYGPKDHFTGIPGRTGILC